MYILFAVLFNDRNSTVSISSLISFIGFTLETPILATSDMPDPI